AASPAAAQSARRAAHPGESAPVGRSRSQSRRGEMSRGSNSLASQLLLIIWVDERCRLPRFRATRIDQARQSAVLNETRQMQPVAQPVCAEEIRDHQI